MRKKNGQITNSLHFHMGNMASNIPRTQQRIQFLLQSNISWLMLPQPPIKLVLNFNRTNLIQVFVKTLLPDNIQCAQFASFIFFIMIIIMISYVKSEKKWLIAWNKADGLSVQNRLTRLKEFVVLSECFGAFSKNS